MVRRDGGSGAPGEASGDEAGEDGPEEEARRAHEGEGAPGGDGTEELVGHGAFLWSVFFFFESK